MSGESTCPHCFAVDALQLLAAGGRCETSTNPANACRDADSGRARDAKYEANRWCDPCIATDALLTMGVIPQ